MAKVIIEIEDKIIEGKVKTTLTPSVEDLLKKLDSGHGLTSAEGYALVAANAIREASNSVDPMRIPIPRLG